MITLKLREVLMVIKKYFRDDVGEMTVSILEGAISHSPVTVHKENVCAYFATGSVPFVKTMRNEQESWTEYMEWEDVKESKQCRCIAFSRHALNMDFGCQFEIKDYKDVTISRSTSQGPINVNIYSEIINDDWKGLRVLPFDWTLKFDDDSDTEEPEEPEEQDQATEGDWQRTMRIKRLKKQTVKELDADSNKENQDHQQLYSDVQSEELYSDDDERNTGICLKCGNCCHPNSEICNVCAQGCMDLE